MCHLPSCMLPYLLKTDIFTLDGYFCPQVTVHGRLAGHITPKLVLTHRVPGPVRISVNANTTHKSYDNVRREKGEKSIKLPKLQKNSLKKHEKGIMCLTASGDLLTHSPSYYRLHCFLVNDVRHSLCMTLNDLDDAILHALQRS